MKPQSKYYIFLLAMVLFSCQNKKLMEYENYIHNNQKIIVRKIYDKTGDLITEEQLNSDSIRNGVYKNYEAGKNMCIGYFTKGKKDSTWLYFNYTGDILKKENWFEGKKFGEQIEYFGKIKAG